MNEIVARASRIVEQLKQDAKLGQYVDSTLPVPEPYRGAGTIKLIVLGQDPTVKRPESRKAISTVLNLDKRGGLKIRLAGICAGLGIELAQNVYATNLYKNFFVRPPKEIKEINVFQTFLDAWLPLLQDELAPWADIPVITLGEPILATLISGNVSSKVRDYWGYTPQWQAGQVKPFVYLRAADNKLNRVIFPFIHVNSSRKPFYKARMDDYLAFIKSVAFA